VILGYPFSDLQKELEKEQDRALYLDSDNKRKIDIIGANNIHCILGSLFQNQT